MKILTPFISGDFVEVTPIEVIEEGEVVISKENIKLLLDYKNLGKALG